MHYHRSIPYTHLNHVFQRDFDGYMPPVKAFAGYSFRSNLPRYTYILIALTGFLGLLGGGTAVGQPVARQGVLDLRQTDLSQDDVALRGEWVWYWNQLRLPNQPESAHEFTDFPKLWSSSQWQRHAIPSQGFATYRLTVLLPPGSAPIMLKVPDHYSAYRLFVNGTDVAHDGNPATTAAQTIPHWSTQLVRMPAADTLQLLLQVANFHHAKGGASQAIRIGETTQMEASMATDRALALFLTGCVLMIGLFFLGLYGFSRMDHPMLYFGLFCLVYSYRLIGTNLYSLHTLFPGLPWGLTLRLEYASLYLAIGIFVIYTQSLYPKDTHRRIITPMTWICFLFAGTVLVLPTVVFTQLMNPFLVLMVAYIGYAMYVYWTAYRRQRPGAAYSLMSTGLLLSVFSLILAQYFGVATPVVLILFVGYVGFFFLQALVLAYRFSFALNEARYTEKQFLANMSHEIRTPLNAILGFSAMLETTPLNTDQQEFLGFIRTAGKNLLTIVNDILDIAKIEAGMLPLESIPFSINSLTDSIRTMLQPVASEKNLQLTVYVDPSLPAIVLGDPTRLTQILLNLLSNAIKFTKQGGVTARIEKLDETADLVRVRFVVQDTGIGIAADVLPYIFERFRQASDFTTRYYGGTGLGLNIVKSLTEMQGGWVTVTSRLGEGSCFTLEIPYKIAPSQVETEGDLFVAPSGLIGQNVRILVVEDNMMNQKLALQVLKRLGYTAQVAENGQEALDKLQEEPFDLVLMDIQMPVMDGYTTTRHIRNTLQNSVPIIAMTAHALASEREQCIQAGMNDFLPKPFQVEELQRVMRKYTPMARPDAVADPLPAQPAPAPPQPATSSAFTLEPLLNAVDNDPGFAAEILDLFLEQTPVELEQIRQALTAQDTKTIGRLIHTQKVPIRTFGLTYMSPLIATLEEQIAAGNEAADVAPLVKQYIQAIEAELPVMRLALETTLRGTTAD